MSDRLPEWIAPVALADGGKELEGLVDVAGMSRIGVLLYGAQKPVHARLRFGFDEEGIRFLTGSIRGDITVACQRCLEGVGYSLDIKVCLGIVRSLDKGQRLPGKYEPLLVGVDPVRLSDVLEDELLLCLPAIPMHGETETCVPARPIVKSTSTSNRKNPFDVLAELKQKL